MAGHVYIGNHLLLKYEGRAGREGIHDDVAFLCGGNHSYLLILAYAGEQVVPLELYQT